MVTGYLHHSYAESLAEFGIPHLMPRSGGWILKRRIPGYPYYDAMGSYPLFMCRDWTQLQVDLADLEDELISLTLVADPFGKYDLAALRSCFDAVVPFKQHFVIDLNYPLDMLGSRHHKYYARRSLRDVLVEVCPNPTEFLGDWIGLYANLRERHGLQGIRAFSEKAFASQMDVPGAVLFRAVSRNSTVGMDWYYSQGEVSYGHLAAFSPDGYRVAASYALQWAAIEYFRGRSRWLNLGGGAGVENTVTDGLSLFKKGWATGTRPSFLCGRIFQREKYSEMAKAKGVCAGEYLPAYRKGEFG
jgi:hypothetical protein